VNKSIVGYNVDHSGRINDPRRARSPNLSVSKVPARFKVLASDVVALLISLVCAYSITLIFSTSPNQIYEFGAAFDTLALSRYAVLSPLLIFVFMYGGLYTRSAWESRELKLVFQGTALVGLFDGAMIASGQTPYTSFSMVVVWPIAALSVLACRMALRVIPFGFPAEMQNVVLVGDGTTSDQFLRELRESRCGPVRVLQSLPMEMMAGLSTDGIEYRIKIFSDRFKIPEAKIKIVLAPSYEEIEQAQRLVTGLGMLRRSFTLMLPFHGLAQSGISLHQAIGADFVLADLNHRKSGMVEQILKRGIDLLVAASAIVIIAPLFGMIAVRLKMEGGPVFFTQTRVGKNGRRFPCLKFRSMRVDAEEQLSKLLATDSAARAEWNSHQKLADDPRVTRFGAFLRATSLDELPQLFCVFVGHMSIVGPRPIVAPEVSGYESDRAYCESADLAHYASCKPGITGLWQVSGRARTTHRERVRLDRWYYRNWSIWLDMMIILKTVRAVVVKTGS
jgi:Undecaprenyl-phosphate galactose phosphotransferase WbaP